MPVRFVAEAGLLTPVELTRYGAIRTRPERAIGDPANRWWGTQLHAEEDGAAHPAGEPILRNFFELAGSSA